MANDVGTGGAHSDGALSTGAPRRGLTAHVPSDWRKVALFVVGFLGILLGMISWAIVSPVGASPDEDYHLGSIWCPRPIEGSGCAYETEGGAIAAVQVPELVAEGKCFAFRPEESAGCAELMSDDTFVYSSRFDNGMYPPGYYQFQHAFVGKDVLASVVWMRIANATIALGGLLALALLSSPTVRQTLLVATTVAWVPMGVYFVASVNPSSWAITGCLLYAVGLYSASESTGKRRWGLIAVAALGAILSVTSRADAAFYVLILTLAVWLLIPLKKKLVPVVGASVVLAGLALVVFLNNGQSQNITGDGGWAAEENVGMVRIFLSNLIGIPDYVSGFWGNHWGPGWVDVPLLGWSTLTMFFVAGGLVLVGAETLWPRKAVSGSLLAGALVGIPVVGMTLRHVRPVFEYQGRYMLPLLAVFLFVWLLRRDGRPSMTGTGQVLIVVSVASVANFWALNRMVLRYTSGIGRETSGGLPMLSHADWWPWSASPNVVWLGGSLALAVGLIALFWVSTTSVNAKAPELADVDQTRLPDGALDAEAS